MTGERLTLVQGNPSAPKRKRRLWEGCQTCKVDIGVRSRVLVRAISGPEVDAKGTISGGRKVLVCAMCLARGKFTPHSI